jgi:hypothetical protein
VEDAVVTPNPNYTNPPPPTVPEAIGQVVDAATSGLTMSDAAKIAAGWYILNGILYPPVAKPGEYGPIKPLDWGQGVPIEVSGLNPGYITNVPAQYQQQSPVQSKFSWNQKPFQTGGATGQTFDPNLYRQSPNAPVQPWGLQQMYNPQTQTIENLLAGVQQASTVAPYNVPAAPRI